MRIDNKKMSSTNHNPPSVFLFLSHPIPIPASDSSPSSAMSAHPVTNLPNDVVTLRSDDDDSSFIARLLDSEPHYMPRPDYIRSVHRQDSINSILKVNAHFQFKPLTAFLSINYFNRFLSSRTLPETGWALRLLSVACLSLAAKMEEMYIPWLLDLQMLEPVCVFEPKTIQRMEILVLAALDWRLRSVTPFDYLHYFISMLPSAADSNSTVYSLASSIIVNTTRVVDFMEFPPSVIAAAAVISAAGEGVNLPDAYDVRISRESVRSCHQLMEEYLLDTCPSDSVKFGSVEPLAPPSPMGVLDAAACASCDTHSQNPASFIGSGEAEPENKRLRLSTPDVQKS